MKKSIDQKSTMFEYGTKEQQEDEITKPRALPLLVAKQRDRRPKRLKTSTIKEPVLSGEAKVKWEEARRQAAVKAIDGLLNKAKRKGRPLSPSQLREQSSPEKITYRAQRKARLQRPKAPEIVKAEEEKHYGTHYGTKDPKGSTRRIAKYKTKGGKIKSPPDSPKGREEMASELIAHHQHHLGRHPGGRAQAIAIGLNQAGMSQGQARKSMGNEFIQESAEARLGEMFGAELNLSPVDLMKSMTLASEADVIESLRGIGKAMEGGDAVKAYVDFRDLTQKIATRGVDSPTAVAVTLLKKGNPGGMSGYEKGVAMYGADGMKKMATGHMTSEELETKKSGEMSKVTPIQLPVGKALGKQQEEEFVPKDKPDISKQMPSVGPGIGGASGSRPSVGTGLGKGKGDEKKAYLGEAKITPKGAFYSGSGAMRAGTPIGKPEGQFGALKEPGEGEGLKLRSSSSKPRITQGESGVKLESSLEAKKSMDDLLGMSKGHGGKGPAKTGGGEWHCPNAGPAYRGVIEWDEEENQAGSGRAKTGAGTPHPPNAGPAQTGAGEIHKPGREVSKALRASSVPRAPRGMAASMDTWRSATNVLTRTNAMLHPQAPLTPDPMADAGGRPSTHVQLYKSDLMSCENCGRTFAKSHGECPTCSMSKALTCKSCGSSMHKGRDGELKCSACGQGTMKAMDQKSDGSIG